MKPVWKLWRSFRFRLAMLMLASVLMVMLVYSVATYLRLDREMTHRFEKRLMITATQLPLLPPGRHWNIPEPAPRVRIRELREGRFLAASWSEERGWEALLGDWPEVLVIALMRDAEPARFVDWAMAEPVVGLQSRFTTGSLFSPRLERIYRHGTDRPLRLPLKEVKKMRFQERTVDGSVWLVGGLRLPGGVLWVAENIDRERAALRDLVRAQGRLGPVLLVLVLGMSWVLATRALRPVRALTAAMGRISERNLTERLTTRGAATEFRDLVEMFNGMLERLQRSFQQASRFSADASHELRTPLTVLQGELEAAVQQTAAGSPEQEQFSSLLEEVQRLRMMIDRLLQLAHADAGRLVRRRETIDFQALVEEQAEVLAELAPTLELVRTLKPVSIEGDPALLRQGIMNLLTNALKYNRPEGYVHIALTTRDGIARLRVSNSGCPIPEEAQPHVFDRFYRGDRSRNRMIDGLGLGLSLAREIARAHGGELSLVASTAEATIFELVLPRATSDVTALASV